MRGVKTATKLLKERYLWNAGNNEEGLNTTTHARRGTVCAGTPRFHTPWGAISIFTLSLPPAFSPSVFSFYTTSLSSHIFCIYTTLYGETAHLSVSFNPSLGGRRDALSEGDADLPPVCVRLERETEEVSEEGVKDGDERGGGNAIKHSGCQVNNGEGTAEQLQIDLPWFWPPSAPSESSGNTSPV